MVRHSFFIIVSLAATAVACRSNPFGGTQKSIEEFSVFTTDFSAQNDGGAKAALLDVIGGAKVSLNCAFSALTLSDVTNALVGRARAGVQVKVAFDADVRDNDTGSLALQSSGAFLVVTSPSDTTQSQLLYGNGGSAYMRHNFCMADERYIYISTAAPDDTQMRKTPNIALKFGSPQFGIARDFLRESNMFSQLLFGNGKAKTDFTTKFTALNQVIGAYWGPQEDPLDVLGTELSETKSRVDFYSTAFQTTNSSKTDLDVPQVLQRLESAKGIPLNKYFSSQALFDSAGKAYTLNTPYQYINNSTTTGANIFVMDRGSNSAKVFIYTGAIRSQGNSSDDSVLLELRGRYVAEIVGAYLDKIAAASVAVSNVGDVSSAGAVVISEINWAGSYSDAGANDSTDNFVEFYNTTSSAINISDWWFACTTNGTSINSKIKMPSGAIIPAGGFFTIAAKNTGAYAGATYITSSLALSNSSIECRLTNGKSSGGFTGGPYYGDSQFVGGVVDTAGDGATAFNAAAQSARLGLSDATNKMQRSMERIFPVAAGTNLGNWQTNLYNATQNTGIASGFQQRTFSTPGSVSSTIATLPGLKINEIGVSSASNDFVELYNPTSSAINLSSAGLFLQRDSACDLTNGVTEVLALSGTIPAGGYYVIANSGNSLANVNQANLGNISSGYCLVLTTTNIPVGASTNSFIVDWVTIAGTGTAENGSRAPDTGANGAISRSASSADTNTNAVDFQVFGATPGAPLPAVPTVTNVGVTSTNPNNGLIPYNTGDTVITITGTDFSTVACPSGVKLNDLVPTVASSCTVVSGTSITATIPPGVRTNASTGWDVIVTNAAGSNTTSAVKYVPVAGLLISEVLIGTTTSASNEYIELYNPTATSLNLQTLGGSGISLRRRTATGGTDAALGSFTFVNTTIPSHGFFLAVSSVASAETWYAKRDATFTAALSASNIAYVSLTTNLTKALDQVGWGTITDVASGGGCEGGNANCTNLASNDNSIERKPAGGAGHATDTGNNAADFNPQSTTLTPRGTADPAQP